jgi:hypothetical protein
MYNRQETDYFHYRLIVLSYAETHNTEYSIFTFRTADQHLENFK